MRLFLQRLTMLIFVITVICAMSTMALSWQTNRLKAEQVKVEGEIAEVRTGIRVLDAEWSRLNQPSLLEAQAVQYLNLQKNEGNIQIANIEELPLKSDVVELINKQRLDKQQQNLLTDMEDAWKKPEVPKTPSKPIVQAPMQTSIQDAFSPAKSLSQDEFEQHIDSIIEGEQIAAPESQDIQAFDPINEILGDED
ncbi:MAG: hypothetical protein ACK5MJ_06650 [Alphaproteobacteria bacterium]